MSLTRKSLIFIMLSMLLVFTAACSADDEQANHVDEAETPQSGNEATGVYDNFNHLLHLNTKNITRLNSDDPVVVSVLTSQTIWPATHEGNKPGTIMLAPLEQWQIALSSLNLVHHPNDGPLLYTTDGFIPDIVMNEINRLKPKGNIDDIQIMVLGELNEGETDKLEGYQTTHLNEVDPAAFAYAIDEAYAQLINHVPNSVIIGSYEDEAKLYTIPAGSWITHMDESLLYVSKNDIPEPTINALQKREGKAHIYLIGPEHIISNDVKNELQQYGKVVRISGETPEQVAIEFAKYKNENTGFGWGVAQPGHGLVFISTHSPHLAITAAPFAHLGKHAPMLWLPNGELNEQLKDYLAVLKPKFKKDPTEGPYNHGYLIGSENLVSFYQQGRIDDLLEIVPADGAGHGDHGGHGAHSDEKDAHETHDDKDETHEDH